MVPLISEKKRHQKVSRWVTQIRWVSFSPLKLGWVASIWKGRKKSLCSLVLTAGTAGLGPNREHPEKKNNNIFSSQTVSIISGTLSESRLTLVRLLIRKQLNSQAFGALDLNTSAFLGKAGALFSQRGAAKDLGTGDVSELLLAVKGVSLTSWPCH